MKKILLILLASTALVISSVRCTSSDTSGETGDQIASEGGENPESVSPEASVGDATGEVGSAETLSEGNLADPNLADPNAATDPSLDPNAVAGGTDTAQVTDPNQQALDANGNPVDPGLQTQSTPPAETQPAPTATDTLATNPPTETVPAPAVTETAPVVAEVPKAPPPPEYQKMKTEPWKSADGKNLNTVYFARKGDTVKSISEKLFGDATHVKELKKNNPVLKNREAKVGDKIYYTSTTRPDDSSKIITYYEDKGIQPQVYTAKEGDKVKNVAKELLGSSDGWKELYGSNSFESRKTLDPGTEVKYWKDDAEAAAPAVAKNDLPPPPPAETAPPPPVETAATPPPPPPDMGTPPPPPPDMAETPPPPPPDMGTPPPPPPDMAGTPPPPPPDMGTPPPPPDMAGTPPPPPPDMQGAAGTTKDPASEQGDASTIAGMDQETIMIVGIGAAALLLAVIFIVKRKNKQRQEFEQAMNETQVG